MKLLISRAVPLAATTAFSVALAAATCSAAPAGAPAKPAPKPEVKPERKPDAAEVAARQLLKDSAAAYKALSSYSSQVSWQRGTAAATLGRVAWQKPGLLMAEAKVGNSTYQSFLGDDKIVTVRTSDGKTRYTSEDVPQAARPKALARASSSVGPLPLVLAAFVGGDDPLNSYAKFVKSVSHRSATAADAEGLDVASGALDVVEAKMEFPQGEAALPVTMSYALGKADHLLRRYSINYKIGERAISQSESYTEVKANPTLDGAQLAYTPAADAKLVADLDPTYDERLVVGATPIALQSTDTAGKPISFGDYKGKVVLVDFWATWCGPCRGEMPNVIAAYNKYHAQGFDVVGISLDQDKAALDKYIAENKMPWRQVFDGKGWDNAVGKQFGVRAIPFALILGRDGKIAALNARGEALAPAIEAALAKPE